jgi:hypothetical protein
MYISDRGGMGKTVQDKLLRNKNEFGEKVSRKRPGVAQRVPGGLGSEIFMTVGT